MNSISLKFRTGRLVWTVLVTIYFLVFFRNFFADALPVGYALSLVFACAFVLWLAVEYYLGSPFFQSGVVEASALGRGVIAFFVYPYLGYVVADRVWWHWTQLPLPPVVAWVLGMLLFGAGVYVRLVSLFDLVRLARVPAGRKQGRGRPQEHRLTAQRLQRLCRHPRYLATLLQLVGAALVFNSWGGLVLVVAIGLPLVLLQVRHEDRGLSAMLKGDFRSYADRVPLLWPRLRRSA
jgi:protein-S-isoprenylcysteine O-methyltransferase Ste14